MQKRLVLICEASLDPDRSNDHRRVCPGRYKLVSEPTLAVTRMVADRCVVMLFMTFVTVVAPSMAHVPDWMHRRMCQEGTFLWPDEDVGSSEWGCM